MAVKRWALSIFGLLLVAAVIWLANASYRQGMRASKLADENDTLRRLLTGLSRRETPPAVPPAAGIPAETRNAPRSQRPPANPEDAVALHRLTVNLADANASIARLQSRAEDAEAQLQNFRVDNKRLTASETDLKENLSAANQAIDALQKELKGSRERATQVEIAYQKLRDQTGGDARKVAQLQQSVNELQDIYQHRDVYLNNILRRYKQITEQYRSLSGVLQAQRTDAPGAGSTDLARIQDSIAMAEEDLRQLNNLNAQALRLQKRMTGK